MGQHSIRGVLTGKPLEVRGTAGKAGGRHRISGGEYTTYAGITYSIAPQGPNVVYNNALATGRMFYCDKIHRQFCGGPRCVGGTCDRPEWRRDTLPYEQIERSLATVTPLRPGLHSDGKRVNEFPREYGDYGFGTAW